MAGKDHGYLQTLVDNERPARMVGIFTARQMKSNDLVRLADACQKALREEDGGASLTLSPVGAGAASAEPQRTFRISVVDNAGASPHDCLVQLYDLRDPESPHRALLDHIGRRDAELSAAASHLQQTAQAYIAVASGRLDDVSRVHPFQNLVSLFTSALGAAIVDPAAAIVTTDPGEWADAMEQSLQLEKEMAALRR